MVSDEVRVPLTKLNLVVHENLSKHIGLEKLRMPGSACFQQYCCATENLTSFIPHECNAWMSFKFKKSRNYSPEGESKHNK